MRIPLYSRVLLWFSLNLLLLLVLGFFFMRAQFKLGLDWFLSGPTGERIEMLADQLTSELRFTPEANWPSILTRYEASSGITLALFGNDGTQKLGSPLTPTETVRTQLIDRRSASDLPPPPRPKGKNAKEREPKARDFSQKLRCFEK